MKAWAALLLISGGFTAIGFFLLFAAESLDVGMVLCFASFVFGNFLGRRVFDRMRANEASRDLP